MEGEEVVDMVAVIEQMEQAGEDLLDQVRVAYYLYVQLEDGCSLLSSL